VHPVAPVTTLGWKADTAVLEFDDRGRATRVVLRDGGCDTKCYPARHVRYLTGTDKQPAFNVEVVMPDRREGPLEATKVMFAHDVPCVDYPGRKLHFVGVYRGERRIWERCSIQ